MKSQKAETHDPCIALKRVGLQNSVQLPDVYESLEDRRYVARRCLLYKSQHALGDIDSAFYLMPGDSCTRNRSRNALKARFNATPSFQGTSGNGTRYHPQYPQCQKWVSSRQVWLLDSALPNHTKETIDMFVDSFTSFNKRHEAFFYPPSVCPASSITFHLVFPVLLLESISSEYVVWLYLKTTFCDDMFHAPYKHFTLSWNFMAQSILLRSSRAGQLTYSYLDRLSPLSG